MQAASRNKKGAKAKKTSRTRTGCVTCKNRRVKCDETKPHCLRCLQSSRECEGYDPPKAWIFEPRRNSSQSSDSSDPSNHESKVSGTLIVSPHAGLPLRKPEDPRMHALLDRFYNYTTSSNALYGNRDLWTRLLPQLIRTEPAVKHLGVALVSITGSHSNRAQITGIKQGPNANPEYLEHVNKALTRIVRQPSDFDPAVILPCCLLLALGESLRTGSPFPSLQHVKAGIAIVDNWLADGVKVSGSPAVWEEIVTICKPLFRSLVRRATALGICGNIVETTPWLQRKEVDMSHVPSSFEDIHTASLCLDAITSFWVVPLLSVDSFADSNSPTQLQILLDDFLSKYDDFVGRRLGYGPSPSETAKLSILRAGHAAASVIARCFPSSSEMVFDEMNDTFGEIVQIFQSLLKNSHTLPLITSDDLCTPTGRIMPLFITATRCRDVNIRTEAAQILQALEGCAEAAWNNRTAFRIADAVISLEDRLMQQQDRQDGGNIPECGRIRLVFASFEKHVAPEIVLSYTTYPYHESRVHQLEVPLNDPEDVAAASQIDWISRLGLLTTPPFLTDVSPWSLFCRQPANKVLPRS